VPIWFGGQNSRLFQIASHMSQTIRLSLIFHEVKARIGAALPVGIARRSPSPRSPQSGTDRRSRMTCARASTRWRSLLRRPSTSRDARSSSCCGRSCPCRARTARPKGPRRSRSGRLVQVGEQGQVFLDHALRELRDIGLVEIVGGLEIDFLNVQELPVSLDFVANVIAIELGPGF
jgi:hypothetical protein